MRQTGGTLIGQVDIKRGADRLTDKTDKRTTATERRKEEGGEKEWEKARAIRLYKRQIVENRQADKIDKRTTAAERRKEEVGENERGKPETRTIIWLCGRQIK